MNKTNIIFSDFVIIGAGIIGLTLAFELKQKYPNKAILIIDKEQNSYSHASGRNSGVIHSGFYYSPDSLKAKFTRHGNKLLLNYCKKNNINIDNCGKVVVSTNDKEDEKIHELYEKGLNNHVKVYIYEKNYLSKIEPLAKTNKMFLYSPSTSVLNPIDLINSLVYNLKNLGCNIFYEFKYIKNLENSILCIDKNKEHNIIKYNYLINSAGLYSDKIAEDFGVNQNEYKIIPFKGSYLCSLKNIGLQKCIYPVPYDKNPFLGIHFTKTISEGFKIGPTAIPVLWREGYKGLNNFNFSEFKDIFTTELNSFIHNNFNFRNLAKEEIKKYYKPYFIKKAQKLINIKINHKMFNKKEYGIRAQLFDIKNKILVDDFIYKLSENSLHILNSVSPALTCSFAIAQHLTQIIEQKTGENQL